MELYKKILLTIICLIPFYAYLDYQIIRNNDFGNYLYICTLEILIFSIGYLCGVKTIKKQINNK